MMITWVLLALVSVASASSSSSYSCSAPPPSLEVCLSQVFLEIEGGLSVIAATLQKNEAGIKSQMHHEHTLLHSEVSWVSLVESIASSVKSAVDVDYVAVAIEISRLQIEINALSAEFNAQLEYFSELNIEIEGVINQRNVIIAEYEKIYGEKWSLYSAISAIEYEKLVIQQEQGVIMEVVAKLNEEMQLIYQKIAQLDKRQSWLLSWEEKLSADLHEFQSDIVEFRAVEIALYEEELSLYAEQESLLLKVEAAESCLLSLEEQYSQVFEQLQILIVYEGRLRQVQVSVSAEASIFIAAYEQFTCEDDLLYYEACSKSFHTLNLDVVPASASAAAVAPVEQLE